LENSNCCLNSSIRSGSIHSGSYCKDCMDCCMGYCNLENSSCIRIGSYHTDCCSSSSNFHRCTNSLVGKGCIVQRLGCCLPRLSLRQERQPMRVLWHHVSSNLHISPLRHYTL
jgi:hypothetical protein